MAQETKRYKANANPGVVVWRRSDNNIELYRPINGLGALMRFKRARCRKCGNANLDVSLTPEGWTVECENCDDAACMLSEFRKKPDEASPFSRFVVRRHR